MKSIVRYHQKKERKRDLKDKAKDFIDIYLEKLAEHEQEERNPLFKGESGKFLLHVAVILIRTCQYLVKFP